MSAPVPIEDALLAPAIKVLAEATSTENERLELLEAASSLLGGYSLPQFRRKFHEDYTFNVSKALSLAWAILAELRTLPMGPALALAALARPLLSESEKKRSGAYYTDFRLATYLADAAKKWLRERKSRVIDPAAGSGILLAAAAQAAHATKGKSRSKWLAENVVAWDRSPAALRGTRLALASLSDDLTAVEEMVRSWRCHDSLVEGAAAPGTFEVVIGNPPWEKLKLSRHEFARGRGVMRHYGEAIVHLDEAQYSEEKDRAGRYAQILIDKYPLLGRGEPDLYKAFLELFLRLVAPGGCLAALVPAGLIRSQGTEDLRRAIFESSDQISISILDNRARFFQIDTRFKFIRLVLRSPTTRIRRGSVAVTHATGTDSSVCHTGIARMGLAELVEARADLTVPEVKSHEEWSLFQTMTRAGHDLQPSKSRWKMQIVREVDMTRDRARFCASPGVGKVPLIEGRMVHQHRFGAKAYRSGSGRKAIWETTSPGAAHMSPQFWYPIDALTPTVRERTNRPRAGFCDITGQTNERSMLAALVSPGTVCGNKVPTVMFEYDDDCARTFLWLAIVNSIPFDWALRRVVTTTVNYFVLYSVPFPALEPDSLPGRHLVEGSRTLHTMATGAERWDALKAAEIRADIDVAVHSAYGLGFAELELVLQDFPLLDRGQPALPGESRSTITRDLILSRGAERFGRRGGELSRRVSLALSQGARPYCPSEFASDGYERISEASDG